MSTENQSQPASRRQHLVVVGGGVVGVSTAAFLARAGHDVTVVERRAAVALETSFANAGRFCPSSLYDAPQANPAVLKSLFSSLFKASIKAPSMTEGERVLCDSLCFRKSTHQFNTDSVSINAIYICADDILCVLFRRV